MQSLNVTALVLALSGCTAYDIHVKLAPQAADRRLASGKSDTIQGALVRADAANLYVRADGEVQAIPRADVAGVDQRLARRDMTVGGIAIGVGAAVAIGGAVVFECGHNDFPVFCAFSSRRNFEASLAMLGGASLVAVGLQKLVSGYVAKSATDSALHVAPTVVQGEASLAPGIAAAGHF